MRIIIAIPVLNEERVLRQTVAKVAAFCAAAFPHDAVTIVIADNGSTDATAAIADDLAAAQAAAGASVPQVTHLRLERRGKGLAIREAWLRNPADAYVFIDADLATDLSALPPAIAAVTAGAGLAIGSRFHPDSVVTRGALRRLLSQGYRLLLSTAFGTAIADAPCGFKVASPKVVTDVLPKVADDQWFFDTELVIRAERAGERVVEVPVRWRDDRTTGRQSKVRVLPLVREYLTKVLRLRREIGVLPFVAPARVIAAREWWLVAAVAALVGIITTIPPLVGLALAAGHGLEWTGRMFLSPGDTAAYLSYIDQTRAGHVLYENLFTTEPLVPLFNIFWLSVGVLARVFGLSAIVAYHAAREALIFPLLGVAYAAISYVLTNRRHRLLALLLFAFGSGLGTYAVPFVTAFVTKYAMEYPIDLWVGESNAFYTMLYSPHFVASLTLIVAALLVLLKAFDRASVRLGAAAGLLGLVLFQFHPFHVPTLYAVGGAALLARTVRTGFRPRQWWAYGAFLLLSAPSVAYHYWLTNFTPNALVMVNNNFTLTPSWPFVLIGFGAIVPLAIAGWLIERNAEPSQHLFLPVHRDFLAVWVVVEFALVFAPFSFQRRMLEGLQFPLLLLSMPALVAGYRMLVRRVGDIALRTSIAALALGMLFLPSSILAITRDISDLLTLSPLVDYFSADESRALAWVRDATPHDAIFFSKNDDGNSIVGWAGRRVYIGHWANTVDGDRKSDEVAAFFGQRGALSTPDARHAFLQSKGIAYVWWDTRFAPLPSVQDPWLEPAFVSPSIIIYRVR